LGANLHLIQKALEKPLIYWAFSIKKLSEVLIKKQMKYLPLIFADDADKSNIHRRNRR